MTDEDRGRGERPWEGKADAAETEKILWTRDSKKVKGVHTRTAKQNGFVQKKLATRASRLQPTTVDSAGPTVNSTS